MTMLNLNILKRGSVPFFFLPLHKGTQQSIMFDFKILAPALKIIFTNA